jgi:hypothetical protein
MSHPSEPPGLARLRRCPGCHGNPPPGGDCDDCDGYGVQLWYACVRCGAVDWDFVNGRNDERGMWCRQGCGTRWMADDPAWLLQRMPDVLEDRRAALLESAG